MFTSKLYKKNVFLIGLVLNSISSAISVALIIIAGIQYKYININWTKLNYLWNLKDFEISLSVIIVICCLLGFFVFIKKFECKTLQKIYIFTGSLIWIYSILVCIICFLSLPKAIKENSSNSCQPSNMKGILKNILKFEILFHDLDKFLCSDDCLCDGNEEMNIQKCEYQDIIQGSLSKINDNKLVSKFDSEKFISYWSDIEDKYDCVGLCNNSYILDENNDEYTTINKYLFTDNRKSFKVNGCIFPLSNYLNKMIMSFGCLVIVYLVISVINIYICFAIYFDKVYEGSNFPNQIIEKGYIAPNERFESINAKINNK